MSDKVKFEKSIQIMRLALLLSGIKTQGLSQNSIWDKFVNKYLYYINLINLYTVILGEVSWFRHGIVVGKSFIELSFCLPLIVISIVSTVKCVFLFNQKDAVRELINTLKDIHPESDEETTQDINDGVNNMKEEKIGSTDRDKIVDDTVHMLSTIITILIVISTGVLIMFCLAPVLIMLFNYLMKGESSILYPFVARYWFDIYDTNYWPLLYLHQVIATGIVCANVFGAELLFYVLCSYIEMHFRLLSNKFETMLYKTSEEVRREIVEAVKKQQQLIYLVNIGEMLFSKSALLHMVTSSFLICLSAFNITMAKDMNTLFAFVTFILLSLSQVSLLCFFGDKLMESSVALSQAVYQCPWYEFNNRTKNIVLIIIMRSQKPCKLTAANFADLNLRAFTTILSRSWSYFALLKTMYNE